MEKNIDNTDSILEFRGVTKSFPGVKALDNVTFSVKKGSVHCLIGENGAGKSTLMKVIDGLYKPEKGKIVFDGHSWHPKGSAQARNDGIAMIHQELNIVSEMTIIQNMYLGREKFQDNHILMDDKKMMEEAKGYLIQEGLEFDLKKKMGELSIAEAQLIEIVKAISCNAKVILMDEPTSSLTEKEVDYLLDKITKLKSQGITIVYISHKMEEIFKVADYISIFRDGKHIETKPAKEYTRKSVIEKMVGREMKEVYPPRNPKIGETILKVENFCKKGVFENIGFEVHKGEILGVSGLVGAGRTEIARALIGLDSKDSGTVYCDGEQLEIHDVNDSIQKGIAMISEDRRKYGLVLLRDIKENMSLVALKHLFKRKVIPLNQEKKLVKEMTETFAIKAPSSASLAMNLSGGNQQKVVIAKWMALNPKVLIMDEPTRGIDVGTKYEIYKLMNKMTEQGMAIIMINSDMQELLGMSDRIIIVNSGHISGEISREEATPEIIMNMAVGGNYE